MDLFIYLINLGHQ